MYKKNEKDFLTFLDAKYKVTKVQPVDMFPHTQHVENVVQLELKKSSNRKSSCIC